MNACSITFLYLCFSVAPSLHYVSYTTHTITNYTKQPTHASKATTKAPKTTMDSNVVSPTTGSRKTAMKTPLFYSERHRRRRRWHPPTPSLASTIAVGGLHRRGYRQHKSPRPSPTMAAATSIVSIACAFQTLDGFLVSGGAAHTPCGCACTLYSPNYQNVLNPRLSFLLVGLLPTPPLTKFRTNILHNY